jgi:predicted transglutaminase-like cysteine proteinase
MRPHPDRPVDFIEMAARIRVRLRAPRWRYRRWQAYLALFLLGAGVALAATPELGFSRSVTKGLVEHFAAKFGAGSRTRIGGWQDFVRAVPAARRQASGIDLELLSSVNTFVNRIPFLSDMSHWGVEDYWATPAEALASNGGDCEDFSIAKYYTLKELGVPIERLRITYVKAVRLNQAHMVLAYYPLPNSVPLILDNLEDKVRPASERSDLIPVYSFNDDDVLLTRPGQAATNAGSSSQIRLWRSLQDKLEKELLL